MPAHRRLVQIGKNNASAAEPRALLDAATKVCPLCYNVRAFYLDGLTPRWGGSHEAMERYAAEVRVLAKDNPRLAALAGFVDWDRCRTAREAKDFETATRACDAAVRAGDEVRFYIEQSRLYDFDEEPEKVLAAVDRALRLEPQHREALGRRSWALIKLERYLDAAKDLITLRHLVPADDRTAENVKWLVNKLREQGDILYRAGKREEAMPYFTLGLQLAPDDNDMRGRAAWAQKEAGLGALDAKIAAAPDDYELRLQRDHALAATGRFDEVVVMWDEFIARHADDPRAYRERSGAKWHLRKLDDSLADLAKSCEFGLEISCKDLVKLKARAAKAK
jgi:tetratricopeptide (TPR) repeat protein